MSPLRASKLWQAIRGKVQLRTTVEEHAPDKLPINTAFPVEILEMIFVHLDFWDLLHCRKVCRLWYLCIPGTSPILRTRMFLPTARTEAHINDAPISGTGDELANLIVGVTIVDNFADHFAHNLAETKAQPVTDYTVHPRMKKIIACPDESIDFFDYNPLLFLMISRAQLRQYKAIKAAVRNGEYDMPLYLGMYATFPPARRLHMSVEFLNTRIVQEQCIDSPQFTRSYIEESGGVTVGKVLDHICAAMWWKLMSLKRERNGKRIRDIRLIPCEEGDIHSIHDVLDEASKGEEAETSAVLEEANTVEVVSASLEQVTDLEPERISLDAETRDAVVAIISLEEQLMQRSLLPRFEWEK